jgi:hypothetical protein
MTNEELIDFLESTSDPIPVDMIPTIVEQMRELIAEKNIYYKMSERYQDSIMELEIKNTQLTGLLREALGYAEMLDPEDDYNLSDTITRIREALDIK